MKKIPVLAALFAALFFCLTAFAADASKEITPIEINGDSVEYFYDQNRAVGEGNVKIDYKGWQLSADRVEMNLKTKEADATGNVVLVRDGSIYKGESVHVNFEEKTADISKVRMAMAPYYFGRGEKVEKAADGHYAITDGYVTTCDDTQCDENEVPYYRVQAKEVLYYPEDKIIIKHAVLRIGNVPFFYIPYLVIPVVDLDRFPVEVEAGRNKEWGTYALTRARYHFSPKAKGNVLFDVREKQKLAGGVEHFYDTDILGTGVARYYYADDRSASESSRYRAQLRHRWKLAPDTALNAEVNKLSDEFVIQDFFNRTEYERIAFPDNYVSLIHAKDDYTLSALARYRLDDFVGVVERTPELRFDTHTHAFEDTPFYWRQEVLASHLDKLEKDTTEGHSEAERVDLRHKLSYVWKPGDVTVTPFVAARETYYSRGLTGDDIDFVRFNLESGADASAKFFKTYEATIRALGLDINQIRHIVTPAVHYRYQSKPSHVRETLYPFDQLDDLDHENFVRFDLENKFQTRSSAGSPRTFLRTLAFADLLTPQMDRSRLDVIGVDVELDPYPWLTISSDALYRFESDVFDSVNVDVVLNRDPVWIGFGQRYVNSDSNQTTAQVDWKISKDWSVRVYERFEFSDNLTDEFEVTVERKNFFCWTVRLTYNYRDGGSFFVSFSPTAFPESYFRSGQNYRRIDPTIPTSGILTSQDY